MILTQVPNGRDPDYIGMYLTKGDAWGFPELNSESDILEKTKFEDYGDIAMEIQLKPSRTPFVVTPSTCEAGIDREFRIEVVAEKGGEDAFAFVQRQANTFFGDVDGDEGEDDGDDNSDDSDFVPEEDEDEEEDELEFDEGDEESEGNDEEGSSDAEEVHTGEEKQEEKQKEEKQEETQEEKQKEIKPNTDDSITVTPPSDEKVLIFSFKNFLLTHPLSFFYRIRVPPLLPLLLLLMVVPLHPLRRRHDQSPQGKENARLVFLPVVVLFPLFLLKTKLIFISRFLSLKAKGMLLRTKEEEEEEGGMSC